MTGKRQIEERWGMEFWRLISDFADQGLTRFDTARALGYRPDSFCSMLSRNPGRDPFENSNKALAYLQQTGETLRSAAERLSRKGVLISEAARQIGYSCPSGLRRALDARGISVKFGVRENKRKSKPKCDPQITRGWPTWGQIDLMMAKKNGNKQ